jgi:putative two-component system response regulator
MNTKTISIFSENLDYNSTAPYEKYKELIQDVAILMLSTLSETSDIESHKHISKTQYYIKLLAEQVHNHPHYPNNSPAFPELLFKSAQLHDIGKVGIPTYILEKRTPLTPSEVEIMKTHTILGCLAIENAQKQLNLSFPFLELAKEIALWHHERWDGKGYPHGLSELEIPDS